MKTPAVDFASLEEILNWLETDGPELLTEKRDVRIFQREGVWHMGSLERISPGQGIVAVLTYGQVEMRSIPIETVTRIEVFNSRRLTPTRAMAEMEEMMDIVRMQEC